MLVSLCPFTWAQKKARKHIGFRARSSLYPGNQHMISEQGTDQARVRNMGMLMWYRDLLGTTDSFLLTRRSMNDSAIVINARKHPLCAMW